MKEEAVAYLEAEKEAHLTNKEIPRVEAEEKLLFKLQGGVKRGEVSTLKVDEEEYCMSKIIKRVSCLSGYILKFPLIPKENFN